MIRRSYILSALRLFSTREVAEKYGLTVEQVRLIRKGVRFHDHRKCVKKRRKLSYLRHIKEVSRDQARTH